MIATHHPKPDRLFPSTKTAIAPTTQHPIAHFPHQTTIAPTTHKPDRKFLKSNSDRPSTPNTRSPISLIKQRSPLTAHKPDRLFPHQTAIAPSPSTKPDRLFPTTNSDR
ncbi:MAG: hypothetical protein ACK54O_15870, partial [Pseudanabaena sp.]